MVFLLNLGWKWTFASLDSLRGAVVLPSGNPIHRISSGQRDEFPYLLFDPQLYLSTLRVEHRTKICSRLACYPWFGMPKIVRASQETNVKPNDRDNAILKQIEAEWLGRPPADLDDAALAAIQFQVERGCTAIILPAAMVEEREDEGATLGSWIDAGIRIAQELQVAQPLLATIAVSQKVLNTHAFGHGGLLEALVDQVAARDLDGVYIVVGQTGTPAHPFEIGKDVARAYLQLVRDCHRAGLAQIVTNFADLIGMLSLGLGASAFVTGQSQTQRGLHLEAFRDGGGGIALPRFYSHRSATEYLTERELDKVVAKRLVRRVSDETDASAALMQALRNGTTAGTLPAWAESQNNNQAANQHYLQRLIAEGHRLRKARPADRMDLLIEWLESAEGNQFVVDRRTQQNPKDPPLGKQAPVHEWRDIIEELAEQ